MTPTRLLSSTQLDDLQLVEGANYGMFTKATIAQLVALARWVNEAVPILQQVQLDRHPPGLWCDGSDLCGQISALLLAIFPAAEEPHE